MNCQHCRYEIPSGNINIQTDVAQCAKCGHVFKISESLSGSVPGFDVNDNPQGTWYLHDFETTTIGATTRHPIALFLVPFMLVWSGGSLGGIYGGQIMSGEFSLFISLFGIPFLIGSIIFGGVTLMAIAGKVEVIFDRNGGKIFTGIGKIGLTKNFVWNDVSTISEGINNNRYPGAQAGTIVFEGRKRLSFGRGLTEGRKYYMIQALKKSLASIKK